MTLSQVTTHPFHAPPKSQTDLLTTLPHEIFEKILSFLTYPDYSELALCSQTHFTKVNIVYATQQIKKIYHYILLSCSIFQTDLWQIEPIISKFLLIVEKKSDPLFFKFYTSQLSSVLIREFVKLNCQNLKLPNPPAIISKVSSTSIQISKRVHFIIQNQTSEETCESIYKLSVRFLRSSELFPLHHFLSKNISTRSLVGLIEELQMQYYLDRENFELANPLFNRLRGSRPRVIELYFNHLFFAKGAIAAQNFAQQLPPKHRQEALICIFENCLYKHQFEHAWSVLLAVAPTLTAHEKKTLFEKFGSQATERGNISFGTKTHKKLKYEKLQPTNFLRKLVRLIFNKGYFQKAFQLSFDLEDIYRDDLQIQCCEKALEKNLPQLTLDYIKYNTLANEKYKLDEYYYNRRSLLLYSLPLYYISVGEFQSFWWCWHIFSKSNNIEEYFIKILKDLTRNELSTVFTQAIESPNSEENIIYLNCFLEIFCYRNFYDLTLRLMRSYKSLYLQIKPLINYIDSLSQENNYIASTKALKLLSELSNAGNLDDPNKKLLFEALSRLSYYFFRRGHYSHLKSCLDLGRSLDPAIIIDLTWQGSPIHDSGQMRSLIKAILSLSKEDSKEASIYSLTLASEITKSHNSDVLCKELLFEVLEKLSCYFVRKGDYLHLKSCIDLGHSLSSSIIIDFSEEDPPFHDLEKIALVLEKQLKWRADNFRKRQAYRCIEKKHFHLAQTLIHRISDLYSQRLFQKYLEKQAVDIIPTSTLPSKKCTCTYL